MTTLKLEPANAKIIVGTEQLFTLTVTEAPEAATISVAWEVDGVTKSDGGAMTFKYTPDTVGTHSIKATATITSEGVDPEIVSKEVDLVADPLPEITGLTLEIGGPDEALTGDKITLSAIAKCDIPKVNYSFIWNSGESSPNITSTVRRTETHTCTVIAKAEGYSDSTAMATKTVEAKDPAPEPVESDIYVHPLPWRNSAYIWCGWWVMDAIEQMTDKGKDWKKATEADTKYFEHLNVLAKMLVDFPEVDVQESRNGRIVHKSALEAGIIY